MKTDEKDIAIAKALGTLASTDDDEWTKEGRPSLPVLSGKVGFKVTAKDVLRVAPTYTRDNRPDLMANPKKPETEAAAELPKSVEGTVDQAKAAAEVTAAPTSDPIAALVAFENAMSDEWRRNVPMLQQILQMWLSERPSIMEHVARARARGRIK